MPQICLVNPGQSESVEQRARLAYALGWLDQTGWLLKVMIKPRIQRRLPECALCLFNTGNPFLFCSVHPQGLTGNTCLDFRPESGPPVEPESEKSEEEQEEGELMGCQDYDHWAQVQKLERLNSHPMFTGQCPDCGYEFSPAMHPDVYWDCLECGWTDQTE